MSTENDTDDRKDELVADLLGGDWGTITVGDLGQRMAHANQQNDPVNHDVLAAYIDAKIAQEKGHPKRETATGASGQFDNDEYDLDAYGTGIQGDDGETPEPRESTKVIRAQAEQARRSASLDDYGTGMAGESEAAELPDETRDLLEEIHDKPEDLDAYGTGMEGDTSMQDYERRKEQTDVMADAFEQAIVRTSEKQNSSDDSDE